MVLSDHAPVMTSMRPGVVGIDDVNGKHGRVFVRGGFADVSRSGLMPLAETAIPYEELSAELLLQEIKEAEEELPRQARRRSLWRRRSSTACANSRTR